MTERKHDVDDNGYYDHDDDHDDADIQKNSRTKGSPKKALYSSLHTHTSTKVVSKVLRSSHMFVYTQMF